MSMQLKASDDTWSSTDMLQLISRMQKPGTESQVRYSPSLVAASRLQLEAGILVALLPHSIHVSPVPCLLLASG